eukprot:TRINITY_DN3074_c2_g2_i1.p1 TRINITY_DN3074_c2_g2~~TRINITY_DN3074_c2_g2_i1.p1  ORF type:complete len:852 (-),score=37.94 TRINITY_DN3074_c2_g2_i1:1230-3785(-)
MRTFLIAAAAMSPVLAMPGYTDSDATAKVYSYVNDNTSPDGIYGNSKDTISEDEIDNIIEKCLTDEQKMRWMAGEGMADYVGIIDWRSSLDKKSVEPFKSGCRLSPGTSVPPLFMMDNGNGFRNDAGAPGTSTVFPPGAALGNTWDADGVREHGALLGRLFKHRGANMVLGPGLTMMRTPFGARNWEYISGEEPVIGSVLGAAYAQGVHSEHVLTQAKHWANNHQELQRTTVTASMDTKTQMELHLKPFTEGYLKYGAGSSVMCGYNKVRYESGNASFWECENSFALNWAKSRYKDFWVGSDWWAVNHDIIDTTKLLERGLDQELPGVAGAIGGAQLTQAVLTKELASGRVDASIRRFLRALNGAGLLKRASWPDNWDSKHDKQVADQDAYQDYVENRITGRNGNSRPFTSSQLDEGARAARKTARDSMVLLRNANDLLPLKNGTSIGEENVPGKLAGTEDIALFGCSASPLTGQVDKLANLDWSGFFINGGGSGAIEWTKGSGQVKPLEDVVTGIPTVTSGKITTDVSRFAAVPCDIGIVCYSAYAAEEYIQMNKGNDRTSLGLHTMYATRDYGDAYFGMPTEVAHSGCKKTIALLSSPGHFSGALLKGNEGLGDFDAIVYSVYPGEQFGPAFVDLLWGRNGAHPKGKLTTTAIQKDTDVDYFRTHKGSTVYSEKGAIGHRWFQKNKVAPAYPFGFGLGYSPVKIIDSPLWAQSREENTWTFSNICIENMGSKYDATEVVQFYMKKQGNDYLELFHFWRSPEPLLPLARTCLSSTSIPIPTEWDAASGEMVPVNARLVEVYISTQGVSMDRFGSSAEFLQENAGAGNTAISTAGVLGMHEVQLSGQMVYM